MFPDCYSGRFGVPKRFESAVPQVHRDPCRSVGMEILENCTNFTTNKSYWVQDSEKGNQKKLFNKKIIYSTKQ